MASIRSGTAQLKKVAPTSTKKPAGTAAWAKCYCSLRAVRPPTAPEAHPLAQGRCPLGPGREHPPFRCRSEAAAHQSRRVCPCPCPHPGGGGVGIMKGGLVDSLLNRRAALEGSDSDDSDDDWGSDED
eukprot:scaffold46836_cov36-Phaeocystis_antarctica.AAC.1